MYLVGVFRKNPFGDVEKADGGAEGGSGIAVNYRLYSTLDY